MLNLPVAIDIQHIDAQPVVRSLAVLQLHLGEHLLVALGLEHRPRNQALIPQRQVVRGHGQFTSREHPAESLLGRHAQRPECVAIIRRCVHLRQLCLV